MYRSIRWPLALLCLVLSSPPALRAAPATPPTTDSDAAIGSRIDAIIAQPRFSSARWGIAVVSLDDGRMLYSHHADQLFQPASTAKLFTAALALDTLGPDRRTSTRLLANGTIHGKRLDGNLVLYGMGDPTLGASGTSTDWAGQLASQLVSQGITRVQGDLIADDSYFAGPLFGSGWEVSDLLSWFAVPASALSVRENVARLVVTPAARTGSGADVSLDPPLGIPSVVNRMTTSAPGTRDDVNLYRAPGSDTLYAFGSVAAHGPPQSYHLAMVDPARVAGAALRDALAEHGVKLDGHLRVLHWPESDDGLTRGATLIGEIASPTFGDILRRGLKRSQNLYLQNLLLLAGVQAQQTAMQSANPPSGFLTTEAWGLRALRDLLDRIGIAPGQVSIEEGSGLSRQDLVSPSAMIRLLQFLSTQSYAGQLRDALPIAGEDGTLVGRMRGTAAAGNLHAKTGSMTFVNCLAGYVTTARGEHLAFAIMLNDYAPSADAPPASRSVDAIAELLSNYRGAD